MAQTESEPFVTPVEAAAFLRCSPVTVKRLARLPAHISGEPVRIGAAAGSSTEADAARRHRHDDEVWAQLDAERDPSGKRQNCRTGNGRGQKKQ